MRSKPAGAAREKSRGHKPLQCRRGEAPGTTRADGGPVGNLAKDTEHCLPVGLPHLDLKAMPVGDEFNEAHKSTRQRVADEGQVDRLAMLKCRGAEDLDGTMPRNARRFGACCIKNAKRRHRQLARLPGSIAPISGVIEACLWLTIPA